MNMLFPSLIAVSVAVSTLASAEEADQCKSQVDDLQASVSAVTAKYKPQLDQLSKTASERAQQISDDTPKVNNVEAVVKFKIKVTSHDQEFIFGLPSATMRTQSIKMDLPEVTSHRVSWKWDMPVFGSHQECINGPPELVCSGFNCHFRAGSRICTDVPDVAMRTQEASMDVPDVAMRTKELKFDLPEFTMVQQRIVLTIPDFTLENVQAEMDNAQKEGADLKEQTEAASNSISSQMKVDLKQTTSDKLTAVFSCYEGVLVAQRDQTLLGIDNQINDFAAKAQLARDNKNDDIANSIDTSTKLMVAARQQAVLQFESALGDLHKKRDEALASSTAAAN